MKINLKKKIQYYYFFFLLKQDFVTEIISLESKQSGSATQYTKELMSDPVIFLRKWIGEVK